MTDESVYQLTLSELRSALVDFYMLGRREYRNSYPLSTAHERVDGWLELNGSDFQLEIGEKVGPNALDVLSEAFGVLKTHGTDLGDDIESDEDDPIIRFMSKNEPQTSVEDDHFQYPNYLKFDYVGFMEIFKEIFDLGGIIDLDMDRTTKDEQFHLWMRENYPNMELQYGGKVGESGTKGDAGETKGNTPYTHVCYHFPVCPLHVMDNAGFSPVCNATCRHYEPVKNEVPMEFPRFIVCPVCGASDLYIDASDKRYRICNGCGASFRYVLNEDWSLPCE